MLCSANILIIFFLQSRAVLLSIVLFALLSSTLFLRQKKIKRIAYLGIASLPLVIPMLYLVIPTFSLTSFDSLEERIKIWTKTIMLIKENLWFGVGAGNWQFNYMQFGVNDIYMVHQSKSGFQHPHNEFLSFLAENGLVGSGIMLGTLYLLFRFLKSKRLCKIQKVALFGLVSTLPIAFFSFPFSQVGFVFVFAFLLTFIVSDQKGVPTVRIQVSKWLKFGFLLTTILLVWLGSLAVSGERNTKKMLQYQKRQAYKDCLKAAIKAESFIYSTDLHSTPLATYKGWSFQKLGKTQEMMNETEKAVALSPYNFSLLSNYGYALMKNHRYQKAEKILLKSYEINRYHDATKYNLCILYYNQQNYWNALKWIREIPGYEIEYYDVLNKIIKKLSFSASSLPASSGSTAAKASAAETTETSTTGASTKTSETTAS
ncbi:MAG: O-antigen ligase family protein [Vicingaceae bacterium]